MRLKRIAGLGAVVMLLVLGLSPAGWAGKPVTGSGKGRSVTLLTGDRVIVYPGEPERVEVEPGAGRERAGLTTLRAGGHTLVIPRDAESLLASGRLDRRLFDVTELLNAGYDDGKRRDIPLIIQATRPGALPNVPVPGKRALPAANSEAVRVAKADARTTWNELRKAKGIAKVWLDGKRRVSLDRSVPQIGAPMAWQRGWTGKGIDVAVLDTGIDGTHPDLADKVVAAEDFTGEGTDDGYGHGTHVASTIAGTGEASGGKYQGVAPDADLLNGKVCDSGGYCEESWILAGMQWAAVEQRARVINLSLGGSDTPGVDPVEEAVNNLSARTGALFVVAAGNLEFGQKRCRVGSPASADAALAVAAVDDAGAQAAFSCTGPRVGDSALKPDIAAPGVGIVAARAANGWIGEPGEDYVSSSGTSMATPHVAGAAAILAQQHPAWTGQQLKAALMGTAKPNPASTPLQQGAGLVAVDQAIDATVLAEPAGLSFGTQLWPHDDDTPLGKVLTYRNLGERPVTVRLSARLSAPDGTPAPASALRLSATRLEIPAGGRANVAVTSDTKHDGADGQYSGWIVATAGGTAIGTPVGVEKEVESYALTANRLDPEGRAAPGADVLYSFESDEYTLIETANGSWQRRLPKGRYALYSAVRHEAGDRAGYYALARPMVELGRDLTVTQDARLAKPLSVNVERESARVDPLTMHFDRYGEGDRRFGVSIRLVPGVDVFTAQLGPTVPAAEMISWLDVQGGELGSNGDFRNSPYVYALVFTKRGAFFTGFERTVKDRDLIPVVHEHAAQRAGRGMDRAFFGTPADFVGDHLVFSYDRLPAKVTVLHTADEQVRWAGSFTQGVLRDGDLEIEHDLESSSWSTYAMGESYRERWNVGVFSPRFAPSVYEPVTAFGRNGDTIQVTLDLFSDGSGHGGYSVTDDGWRTTLYRNGEPVDISAGDGVPGFGRYAVPPERADYRVEVSASRERSGVTEFSTRLDAGWTFSSEHVPLTEPETIEGWRPIPAWMVGFSPRVDDHNRSHEGSVQFVPVTVSPNPGSKVGRLRHLSVETSTDDGGTWRTAPVVPVGDGRHLAIVVTPEDATYVSLRTKASDSDRNSYEATIIRAYGLAPS